MIGRQLQLGLGGVKPSGYNRRPRARSARAAWWFARMHRTVDSSADWSSAHPPESEEAWWEHFHQHRKST